jgi:hypothetical protein
MEEEELGYLRFIAQTATFIVEIMDRGIDQASSVDEESCSEYAETLSEDEEAYSEVEHSCASEGTYSGDFTYSARVLECAMLSKEGDRIGCIDLPVSWLITCSNSQCEFILLSADVQDQEGEHC